MPAKAAIQNQLKTHDFRLRGNDAQRRFKAFYETIIFRKFTKFAWSEDGSLKLELNI